MKRKLKILGEFVGHLAIGAAMFVALLLFGGGLNMLVHWFGPIVGDDSFSDSRLDENRREGHTLCRYRFRGLVGDLLHLPSDQGVA